MSRAGRRFTVAFLALLVALAAAGLLAWWRPGQPKKRPLSCKIAVLQISLALAQYTNDWGGYYPDDLEKLLTFGYLPPEFCWAHSEDGEPGERDQFAGYSYYGKGKRPQDLPEDVIILHCARHKDGSGRVLLNSGHAPWLDEERFSRALREQRFSVPYLEESGKPEGREEEAAETECPDEEIGGAGVLIPMR